MNKIINKSSPFRVEKKSIQDTMSSVQTRRNSTCHGTAKPLQSSQTANYLDIFIDDRRARKGTRVLHVPQNSLTSVQALQTLICKELSIAQTPSMKLLLSGMELKSDERVKAL